MSRSTRRVAQVRGGRPVVRVDHVVHCDGCGASAAASCASDLPLDWAAVPGRLGSVRHFCPRCQARGTGEARRAG